MLLNILGVTCGYGTSLVLKNANVQIASGDFAGIVGPNGSGKSTLLRTVSRVLKPLQGKVLLEEEDLYRMPAAEVARSMAVVAQDQGMDFPFTVRDVVMMGRLPHIKRFAGESARDLEAVARAMEFTDTQILSDRQINELSGGEKQRVLLARALAQEPRVLLLDEPTSYLDLNYQIEIMELLVRLRRDHGLTIIMVLHDLNLASRYCDYLLVVKEGSIHAIGSPHQVITAKMIKEVYGCDVSVEYPHSVECPYIVFKDEPVHTAGKGCERWVHLVGGGGSCILLFRSLLNRGWKVSTGVVNAGDSDWREARRLGLPMVEALPFSNISKNDAKRNQEMMQAADFIIMAGIPFGFGNIENLACVVEQAEQGKRVIVVDDTEISDRDYTGGKAAQLYTRLRHSQAHFVNSEWEAIRSLEGDEADVIPG